jgi:hypothetical protein
MQDEEFQKLLRASPPIMLNAHRGKLFMTKFFNAVGSFFNFNILGAITQLTALARFYQEFAAQEYALVLGADNLSIRGEYNYDFAWNAIESVKMAKNGIIHIDFVKEAGISKTGRFLVGSDFNFYNMYTIKTKQLTQLLNHWRERALAGNK